MEHRVNGGLLSQFLSYTPLQSESASHTPWAISNVLYRPDPVQCLPGRCTYGSTIIHVSNRNSLCTYLGLSELVQKLLMIELTLSARSAF